MSNMYNIIAATDEATVVAEYTSKYSYIGSYQTEADLERELIELLKGQGYQYITIRSEADLVANLLRQLELLNDYTFSDTEWNRFFAECIANANEGIEESIRSRSTMFRYFTETMAHSRTSISSIRPTSTTTDCR